MLESLSSDGCVEAEVSRLRIRVAFLEARLEIDSHYVPGPRGTLILSSIPQELRETMIDGIASRDVTIELLEADNEAKSLRLAKVDEMLSRIGKPKWYDLLGWLETRSHTQAVLAVLKSGQ
jgi:hypothetical protein